MSTTSGTTSGSASGTPDGPGQPSESVARVRQAVTDGAEGFVQELMAWLRIPSISGDPEHHGDVRRSAEHLAQALRDTGFPTAEVWEDRKSTRLNSSHGYISYAVFCL